MSDLKEGHVLGAVAGPLDCDEALGGGRRRCSKPTGGA